jgi:hypothetical protein
MKHLLLLFLAVSPLAAQQPEPQQVSSRPAFATSGVETMPMMLIDEAALSPARFKQLPYPQFYWEQEKACLSSLLGKDVPDVGAPPTIIVIPAVRTIRVHQMVLDSMAYASDSTFKGEIWDPPTIAEAVINSNFIVVTEPFQANPYVLRHEALHFLLWRLKLAPLGHPKEYFEPCDVNFNPKSM